MDFLPGDPVSVYNCPNITAFNAAVSDYSTDYWPNGIGIKAIASSNVVGSPSVAIPLTTTANATDSSGYCTIISVPGAPQNTYWVHNTIPVSYTHLKFPATSMTLDFRPTKNSPVVDAGQNLGAVSYTHLHRVSMLRQR